MREIVSGIFTWPWFSEEKGYDFNGYLVVRPDGNLCIDPVQMSDEVLEALAAKGVTSIVLTNRNHSRASARVRERTGARILCHPADAEHVRGQGGVVDGPLEVGGRAGPFQVLAADGKSPGEVALYWPERGILVVGDVCVVNPPGTCAVLPERVMDDPAALRRSLRRLAEVEFDTLLPGDGAAILRGARDALRALVATFGDGEPAASG